VQLQLHFLLEHFSPGLHLHVRRFDFLRDLRLDDFLRYLRLGDFFGDTNFCTSLNNCFNALSNPIVFNILYYNIIFSTSGILNNN